MPCGEWERADCPRILIVEDDDDFRLLLELTLQDEGYLVDCASCAEDAIHLIRSNAYHLVLTDYSLPGHSGAWFLSEAHAHVNDARSIIDRKSTRLNSSHQIISYAVFCL